MMVFCAKNNFFLSSQPQKLETVERNLKSDMFGYQNDSLALPPKRHISWPLTSNRIYYILSDVKFTARTLISAKHNFRISTVFIGSSRLQFYLEVMVPIAMFFYKRLLMMMQCTKDTVDRIIPYRTNLRRTKIDENFVHQSFSR